MSENQFLFRLITQRINKDNNMWCSKRITTVHIFSSNIYQWFQFDRVAAPLNNNTTYFAKMKSAVHIVWKQSFVFIIQSIHCIPQTHHSCTIALESAVGKWRAVEEAVVVPDLKGDREFGTVEPSRERDWLINMLWHRVGLAGAVGFTAAITVVDVERRRRV